MLKVPGVILVFICLIVLQAPKYFHFYFLNPSLFMFPCYLSSFLCVFYLSFKIFGFVVFYVFYSFYVLGAMVLQFPECWDKSSISNVILIIS